MFVREKVLRMSSPGESPEKVLINSSPEEGLERTFSLTNIFLLRRNDRFVFKRVRKDMEVFSGRRYSVSFITGLNTNLLLFNSN